MRIVEKKLPAVFGRSILYPENADLYNWQGLLLGGHLAGMLEILSNMHDVDLSGVIVDVGANYGLASVMADVVLNPHRIDAFECNPGIFETLEKTMKTLNAPTTAYNFAAGGKNDKIKYWIPDDRSSLANGSFDMFGAKTGTCEGSDGSSNKSIEIDRRTLDSVYREENSRVSLIKIDVEGHEHEVLSGAIETIERHRPVIIYEVLELRDHQQTHMQLWHESGKTDNTVWKKLLAGHSAVLNEDKATQLLAGLGYSINYFPWSKCDVLAMPNTEFKAY